MRFSNRQFPTRPQKRLKLREVADAIEQKDAVLAAELRAFADEYARLVVLRDRPRSTAEESRTAVIELNYLCDRIGPTLERAKRLVSTVRRAPK